MRSGPIYRALWLAATIALVLGLLWLDQHRGGPASALSRCNLSLSRNGLPPADVLIIGSSRSGAALDPIAMQEMLAFAPADAPPKVERIALGHNPMRASHALLENYLQARGAPRVIVLEVMFMTRRSIDRLAKRRLGLSPEKYIFRRDVNLITFRQLLSLPSVAMPFTEGEGPVRRWQFRLRGSVLRAGALAYQFLRKPTESWQGFACGRDAFIREPEWPADFAFGYGDFHPNAPPDQVIEALEAVVADMALLRELKPWQQDVRQGQRYPYDFGAPYREGEIALLQSMLEQASRHSVPVLLLPLPLYGYTADAADLQLLAGMLSGRGGHVFDLYGQIRVDLDKFWYDDAHVEVYPAGALTTAILAQHILDSGLLPPSAIKARK
jgi:hypothetical protein